MNIASFLTRTSYALRGTDEDAPAFGGDESDYWIDTLNRKKDELYQDVSKNWLNTFHVSAPNEPGTVATTGTTTLTGTDTYFTDYNVGDTITVDGETDRTIATITSDTSLTVTVAFSNTASSKTFTRKTIIKTGVQSYSLHRSLLSISGDKATTGGTGGGVYVIKTDDQRSNFELIAPEQIDPQTSAVYLSGLEPQTITFTKDIESTDPLVGGELFVPGFYLPDDLSAETDRLPFLDPNWAVMAVAAEIAFNDITYEDKVVDLNNKANALYSQMVRKNKSITYNGPRAIPVNVRRIRSARG